ncbi:hypothetical protein AVEN_7312-1 [Araneus ventricosus]|uniref:Uncharacterized protein n=1 Tax=Araneus ventricosus TaxID=182803 RepID=A0A4Y2N0Z3_ARAVE|nr:hypothetical protein AVEN_7312-1 [Araneus ventricosus]
MVKHDGTVEYTTTLAPQGRHRSGMAGRSAVRLGHFVYLRKNIDANDVPSSCSSHLVHTLNTIDDGFPSALPSVRSETLSRTSPRSRHEKKMRSVIFAYNNDGNARDRKVTTAAHDRHTYNLPGLCLFVS